MIRVNIWDLRSLAFASWLLVSTCVLPAQEKFPKSWQADSTLRSVFFVDYDFGWSVGDKGTILRTDDGGRSWNSISSPRDVIWTRVFFADENIGWIAGGHYRGPLQRSIGILIKTEDGGKSWKNISQNGVSFIRKIQFFDPQNGWMFCDSNALYPSGLLTTSDGGKTWKAAAGKNSHLLKNVSLTNQGEFVAITTNNQLLKYKKRSCLQTKCPLENADDLIGLDNGQILVLGGSVIFRTDDAQKWDPCQLVDGDTATKWTAGCKVENHVWTAGSPGNIVVHSADGGQTWTESRTGILTSLESIFFLDKQRGWAVGALGKIIATKDGGKSWTCQRNNDMRLGILNLASEKTLVSLDASALLAGSFGHVYGTTLFKKTNQHRSLRMDQAVSRCGTSTLEWTQPVEKKFLLQLVQELRMWRPSVLVIHENDSVMKRWIQKSVESAADPDGFPELSESGLVPWKVQKIVSITQDSLASQSISINQFSARLGRTVALQSRFAQLLFQVSSSSQPARKLGWHVLYSSVPSTVTSHGITNGTTAQSDPRCNRSMSELQIDNMQQFRSISNWNQNLDHMGRMLILSPLDEKVWLENVTAATSGMDKICYAFFLADLARKYTALGKPVMADTTERLILQKVAASEIGENATWKMIQRFGSCESNFQLNRLVRVRMAEQQKGRYIDPKVQLAGATSPFDSFGSNSEVQAAVLETNEFDATRASYANAIQLIEMFQNRFPEISAKENIELQIARIKDRAGKRSTLNRLLDSTAKHGPHSRTQIRLSREKNLSRIDGLVPGAVSAADATQQRIMLDADLSEKVWQKNRAGVQYALDDEYLYLAWSRKMAKPVYYNVNRKRTRDENLANYDRVQVLLDFDRDYNSAVELVVDVRGACNDAIWRDEQTRDSTFNPTWYVASRQENGHWSVEAAIPLAELPAGLITATTGWIVQSKFSVAGRSVGLNPKPASGQGLFQNEQVLIFRDTTSAVSGEQ